ATGKAASVPSVAAAKTVVCVAAMGNDSGLPTWSVKRTAPVVPSRTTTLPVWVATASMLPGNATAGPTGLAPMSVLHVVRHPLLTLPQSANGYAKTPVPEVLTTSEFSRVNVPMLGASGGGVLHVTTVPS